MGLTGAGDETVVDSLACGPAPGSGSLLVFPLWSSLSGGGKGEGKTEGRGTSGLGREESKSVKAGKERAISPVTPNPLKQCFLNCVPQDTNVSCIESFQNQMNLEKAKLKFFGFFTLRLCRHLKIY